MKTFLLGVAVVVALLVGTSESGARSWHKSWTERFSDCAQLYNGMGYSPSAYYRKCREEADMWGRLQREDADREYKKAKSKAASERIEFINACKAWGGKPRYQSQYSRYCMRVTMGYCYYHSRTYPDGHWSVINPVIANRLPMAYCDGEGIPSVVGEGKMAHLKRAFTAICGTGVNYCRPPKAIDVGPSDSAFARMVRCAKAYSSECGGDQ